MSKIVTIQLSLVQMQGYWAVLDQDHLIVGSVSDRVVEDFLSGRLASEHSLSNHEWVAWSRISASRCNEKDRKACVQDEWSLKVWCWLSSINKRRLPKERAIKAYKIRSWEDALRHMANRSQAKARRNDKHEHDPWRLWCESSGSNSAKRQKEKLSNRQAT
jgi:hypothetical protein